jgi:hypothetical protein
LEGQKPEPERFVLSKSATRIFQLEGLFISTQLATVDKSLNDRKLSSMPILKTQKFNKSRNEESKCLHFDKSTFF